MTMPLRIGGVMRCCIATLVEYLKGIEEAPPVGTTLDCKYEQSGNKKLILAADGVWEWNRTERSPMIEPARLL